MRFHDATTESCVCVCVQLYVWRENDQVVRRCRWVLPRTSLSIDHFDVSADCLAVVSTDGQVFTGSIPVTVADCPQSSSSQHSPRPGNHDSLFSFTVWHAGSLYHSQAPCQHDKHRHQSRSAAWNLFRQVALLWQRDRATRLSVVILQLQNIPIVWHYLRDPTFSRFYTIPECGRHTHRNGRTDTRRRHVLR